MASTEDIKDIKDEPGASSEDEENGHSKASTLHENGFSKSPIKQENGTITRSSTTEENHNHDGLFIERYKCHHCEKSYKNLRSLNQHFREVQVCRVCKKSLPSIEEFTNHIIEDHTVGALCGVCMSSFRSRARLVEHVSTHTQLTLKKPDVNRVRRNAAAAESSRTCKLCKSELSPLKPHTCHANVCKLCRKPLRTRNEFEVHMMRLHCSEDACQFCGVRLPTIPSLISHLKSHTSLRYPAHKCMKCGQRFSSDARLIAHDCQPGTYSPNLSPSKSHAQHTGSHGKNLDTTKASSPDKNSNSGNGTSGERQQGEESPKQTGEVCKYTCQWCQEKFKYLRDLKRHRLELHSCKFCKKILKTQEEFENHLMEEHSSKDECQFCLRKFVCTNALRTHLKIHTNLPHKLHLCMKCKQKFASVKDKTKHTCLKYRCFYCNNRFGNESDLEVHVLKDHPNSKILKCNSCSKFFPNIDAVKKHIKLKHKVKTNSKAK